MVTYLNEIMDMVLLGQHITNGLVTARPHQSLPLTILNYTPEAQFSRTWDEVTKQCRGLIYNNITTEVVARPFEKFYNWDEAGAPFPPAGPALRMPKMDGSLGILYWDESDPNESKPCISTRGSMHSEQAEWATKYIREFFPGPFEPLAGKTYLFEIIYPENRIVVDYGDHEGLTLIDVIDIKTGYPDTDEFDNCDWDDKVVRKPIAGFDSGQCQDIPDGDEGFVYLWPTRNFRTKMKAAQYVYLHRLISNLNEKTIWEQLVAGETLDGIKKNLPEEFHGFIDEKGGAILEAAGKKLNEVYTEVYGLKYKFPDYATPHDVPRKEIAKEIVKSDNRKYLFAYLDGKDLYPICLRDSKPVKVIERDI